ncbi:precorrin-6y C5,15-methyltransferase (decarboxylating) subunit CbiE [Williamsia deligens]|uniref:Precorrin-6y C5,15-methyltransferase (Decarboxylating) subunit CbiE n=1 Tax=Williamsia deligens TaxID=321325 RepID=A0ABW3GC38_9NOCA|nr:precorrin-6y C5,15-methyltransferase (decarboxylating) subunit CbiE [Williamsia deligens]MCP2195196.1 precorrin-6Y C5,15-methyltransferase (decarboxylating) [Williamsia deligens]
MTDPSVVVVGIGADGWHGLNQAAREALRSAAIVAGSARQLALLPQDVDARRHPWAPPMAADLDALLAHTDGTVHVLASGDPMFHGVGASIVARIGADRVQVIPAVSSASLAAARLGWDLARTPVCSVVTHPVESVLAEAGDGIRLLVLARDASTPAALAAVLASIGFGDSTLTVLADLGGPREDRWSGTAATWQHPPGSALAVVAVECVGPPLATGTGLDDDTFENDGQLTKSAVRALTLSALRPAAGEVLWDIGGGAGSIAVEWCRTDRRCRAWTFEADDARRERIARNAARHGVPHTVTVAGPAPDSFPRGEAPDAIFVGGGLTDPGMLDACWAALRPGGRLVANAVTLESENLLLTAHRDRGGDLRRIHLETAAPLGQMTTWRPILPVTQWTARTPEAT